MSPAFADDDELGRDRDDQANTAEDTDHGPAMTDAIDEGYREGDRQRHNGDEGTTWSGHGCAIGSEAPRLNE